MNNVMGIIFSNMHDQNIQELTEKRCMGSIPVGGRYRLIDFTLSGFCNAGIEDVGVITKSNYQSLMDHLGSGREWDLSRKRGGLIILPPFAAAGSSGVYRDRIEALMGITTYLQYQPEEYILMADCDIMANIDYQPFIDAHMKSGADITVMYKHMHISTRINKRPASTFILDNDGRVHDMLIHRDIQGEHNVYINNLIIKKDLLIKTVAEAYSRNKLNFDTDILQAGKDKFVINSYEYTGYVGRIDDIQSYYKENLLLLNHDVRQALFPKERPIYTKIRDEAPARYGLDCQVSNSLIADGCIVEGMVENSILFRGVSVSKGAKIKNSIVMQGSVIGADCNLQYIICDKNVTISDHRVIIGFDTYPVYISKGSTV